MSEHFTRTPALRTEEAIPPHLEALGQIIQEETEAMLAILPDALARQWSPSPVPKPREDTTERSSGGRPSDPTADTAIDGRRLALRETVVKSEHVLRDAAVRVRAVRRALEISLARYDGEEV